MTATRCPALVALAGLIALAAFHEAPAASNRVYDSTCALCHQTAGAGLKGQFPRLAGRVDRMASDPEARAFVIHTVLHGLAGRIEVDQTSINGVMPSFETLSNKDLASVLNYLISLGGTAARKVKPIAPSEIAAARSQPRLSSAQVHEQRTSLIAAGRLP